METRKRSMGKWNTWVAKTTIVLSRLKPASAGYSCTTQWSRFQRCRNSCRVVAATSPSSRSSIKSLWLMWWVDSTARYIVGYTIHHKFDALLALEALLPNRRFLRRKQFFGCQSSCTFFQVRDCNSSGHGIWNISGKRRRRSHDQFSLLRHWRKEANKIKRKHFGGLDSEFDSVVSVRFIFHFATSFLSTFSDMGWHRMVMGRSRWKTWRSFGGHDLLRSCLDSISLFLTRMGGPNIDSCEKIWEWHAVEERFTKI